LSEFRHGFGQAHCLGEVSGYQRMDA
jgi:hypothetical protein